MTIYYPDISGYQAGMSTKGALVICVKATEGIGYVNSDYSRAKADAASTGTYFTAYHFLQQGNATLQAQHCFSVVGKTPLMLDVEAELQFNSKPQLADVTAFVDEFRRLGGILHLVYLPQWYWHDYMGSPDLGALVSRGLLLVSSDYNAYTDSSSGVGWQSYGGMAPVVWQYTDRLSFNGFSVDFNAFRGSHAGDQSAAAVADAINQFKSIAETGQMTASTGPYEHVVPAGNSMTLDGIARNRNTTVGNILGLTQSHADPANVAIIDAYVALDNALAADGKPRPAMPEGLVYYTLNP